MPVGNPGLATRLIHDFIIVSNTIEMPFELRLEALELIMPSISVVEENLRSRLIKSGFPKDETEHKILNVLVSIEKEFAIGYWIVVKELTQKQVGWLQGKNVALGIQRCIKGLSNIVISHLIMGMPAPDWVWIDLHSLYQLSVKLNKETTSVILDPSRPGKKSTPEICYKQILLLSLADPSGLMLKEIISVYGFIGTIASLVRFQNKAVINQPLQCLILTDEDKPPRFQTDVKDHSDTAVLYIDFLKLYKALGHKKNLKKLAEGRFNLMQLPPGSESPSDELLEYLRQRWLGMELKCASIFGDRLDRYFAIGLVSAHALKDPIAASIENQIEFLAESKSDNILSCQSEHDGVLSVGSLISFKKADPKDTSRSLGIINKIVVAKQNAKIDFGLQLLTPSFFSAFYTLPNVSQKEERQKALFYSLTDAGIEKTYIIADSFLLKEGDIIRIYWKTDDFPVILHNRKNIGLGYWQFCCEKISEIDKPGHSKKGYDFI